MESKLADDPSPKMLIEQWRERIVVAHRKQGRTLTTCILHTPLDEEPPVEALCLAATGWTMAAPGQIVRRPDEAGKRVYWVSVFNQP